MSLQNQRPLEKKRKGATRIPCFPSLVFHPLFSIFCLYPVRCPPFSFLLMRVLLRVWKRNEKKRKETKECLFKIKDPWKRNEKGQLFSFSLRKGPFSFKGKEKKTRPVRVACSVLCAPPFLLRVWKRNEKKRKETKRNEKKRKSVSSK